MRLLTPPRNTVRHALWVGGLLVVLGGLFGMHGLDNHGAGRMDSMAHATMTVPAHGATGHEATTDTGRGGAAVANAVRVAVAYRMTDASGRPGMDMSATGMCMAVLVLSLFLLVLRLYAGRLRPLLWLTARPVLSTLVRGRDPDPPSLFCLSIQRC